MHLPSQTVRRTYVGPNGAIITQEQPERDVTSEPKRHWQNAAAQRQKRLQEMMYGVSDDESDTSTDAGGKDRAKELIASGVVSKLRQQVQRSEHGLSSTRCSVTNRLAENLAIAKITANRLAGPVVVDMLDEQMQCEILAALPIEDMGNAAQTCKSWSELLSTGLGECIWERLVTAAPIHIAAKVVAHSAPPSLSAQLYWQTVGRALQQHSSSLLRRWRAGAGACKVEDFPSQHTDYIMAMTMHAGALITGGADKLIALTDMTWARRRTRVKRGALAECTSHAATAAVAGPSGLSGLSGVFDDEMTAIILRRGSGASSSSSVAKSDPRGDEGPPPRILRGHRGQILCLHPHGERLASCSNDGEVLIWSLTTGGILRRHRAFGSAYSLSLSERAVAIGGDGSVPVRLYDWRDGRLVWEADEQGGEQQAPQGVTTCLHQQGSLLCAGNSDTHSQLRIWDLRSNPHSEGSLRDCFSLPPYVKGVRSICAPTENTLICGTTNGWLVHFDLRSGRYEKKEGHTDCVNGLCAVPGSHILASGGDDKMIRLTDMRMADYQPVGSHRLRSVVFSLCADEEALYAGVEEGDLKTFDYSAEANPIKPRGSNDCMDNEGGFTAEQKAALAAAMSAARNRRPPGAFR